MKRARESDVSLQSEMVLPWDMFDEMEPWLDPLSRFMLRATCKDRYLPIAYPTRPMPFLLGAYGTRALYLKYKGIRHNARLLLCFKCGVASTFNEKLFNLRLWAAKEQVAIAREAIHSYGRWNAVRYCQQRPDIFASAWGWKQVESSVLYTFAEGNRFEDYKRWLRENWLLLFGERSEFRAAFTWIVALGTFKESHIREYLQVLYWCVDNANILVEGVRNRVRPKPARGDPYYATTVTLLPPTKVEGPGLEVQLTSRGEIEVDHLALRYWQEDRTERLPLSHVPDFAPFLSSLVLLLDDPTKMDWLITHTFRAAKFIIDNEVPDM